MKTILVATDYSRGANNALEFAASLAKRMAAKLVIFNAFNFVVSKDTTSPHVPDIDDLILLNNKHVTRIGKKISEAYAIQVECVTTTDVVLKGLHKQVKKHHADLVVMGARSGKSLVDKLFGSVTTSVIKNADYPVLIVPEDANFRGLRSILFACDYQLLRKNSKLDFIRELASLYDANVEILHIEKNESISADERKQLLKKVPHVEEVFKGIKHTYKNIYDEDVAAGIERNIREFNADLVVMIPRKTSFWESLVSPSLTKKMAIHTNVPLLALPHVVKTRPGKKVQEQVKTTV